MTETDENKSPQFLVRVTHPDPEIGVQQVRIDAEDADAAPGAARAWLAGAHNDLRYSDAPAELVDESGPEPEGVGTASVLEQPGDPGTGQAPPSQVQGG